MKFDYMTCKVKDVTAHATPGKGGGKPYVHRLSINGEDLAPTQRFWNSLYIRFGFSSNIFRYFSHLEVFNRISEVAPGDEIAVCVERHDRTDGMATAGRALAISSTKNPPLKYEDVLGALAEQGVDVANVNVAKSNRDLAGAASALTASYAEGVIRSVHVPAGASGRGAVSLMGDAFNNQYVLETPIDGLGKPAIYLMLLRQICGNGAIGYSQAFRTDVNVGRRGDGINAIGRALEGFDNEEGFQAIQQRFTAAGNSWASVNEINRAYRTLVQLHGLGHFPNVKAIGTDGAELMEASPIIKSFHKMAGDLTGVYGLANLDALSVRRQRTLPTGAKVYNLLNFLSEVATHRSTATGAIKLHALIGDMIKDDYDLEGSVESHNDWKDFLVEDASAVAVAGNLAR